MAYLRVDTQPKQLLDLFPLDIGQPALAQFFPVSVKDSVHHSNDKQFMPCCFVSDQPVHVTLQCARDQCYNNIQPYLILIAN
jgi:hypothetical protein